jgi:trans-aconitate methyltransferase
VVQTQISFPAASASLASEEHARAALDLLSRMQNEAPRRIADLRVGPPLTQGLLAQRFPNAEIVSLDASDASRLDRVNGNAFDLIFSSGDFDYCRWL